MIDPQALRQSAARLRQEADALDALARGTAYISEDERRGRAIVRLMAEVEKAGGRIRPDALLEIGAAQGYSRHGVGGFYGPLAYLATLDGMAVLHEDGKKRLQQLRERYRID